jgi:hypothetical protein
MSLPKAESPRASKSLPGGSDVDRQKMLNALRALVVECPELRELEKRLAPFNLFDVLKSTHNEIRHSNVLAWLLDPNGSHGMRELFLRHWLMRVFYESEQADAAYLDPVDIDSTPFKSVEVRREWKRIDLLVKIVTQDDHQWIICIENKVRSRQSANQLERYRGRVESEFPKPARRFYILLTVRDEEADDAAYIVGTYTQVSLALEICRDEVGLSLGEGPRLFIEQYLSILQQRFMENSEVTNLARKIYAAHKLALDTMIRLRPDNLLILTEKLKTLLDNAANEAEIIPKYKIGGRVRFVPKGWDIPQNSGEQGRPIVLCEIKFPLGNPLLRAFVGPTAPQGLRKRLHDLAKAHRLPWSAPKAIPKQKYSFYAVPYNEITLEDIEDEEEVSAIAEDLWRWVREEVSSDRFKEMATTVVESLKSFTEAASSSGP